jgi:hypothetical protein
LKELAIAEPRISSRVDNLRQSVGLLGKPARCIHVGDRESDIFELYCMTRDLGTHFIVRMQADRLAGDGDHTISDEMDAVAIKGLHRVEVRNEKGDPISVTLEIRTKRVHVLPPRGKQNRYQALDLTVIHATERGAPKGRKPIEWKLITDLPARTRGGHRKDRLVCHALEDRGLPQNPQIRLPRG